MKSHLEERGINFDLITPVIAETGVSFYLYNLSGQIVGYQFYNPNGTKKLDQKKADKLLMKYFTWVGGHKKDKDKKIGVWGLESYRLDCKRIFITEGLFDAAVFHNYGECAIATLCNDPSDYLLGWLRTLPQEKIVVADNDLSGNKLWSAGDRVVFPPSSFKDANELWMQDRKIFLEWFKQI